MKGQKEEWCIWVTVRINFVMFASDNKLFLNDLNLYSSGNKGPNNKGQIRDRLSQNSQKYKGQD